MIGNGNDACHRGNAKQALAATSPVSKTPAINTAVALTSSAVLFSCHAPTTGVTAQMMCSRQRDTYAMLLSAEVGSKINK